MLSGGMPKLKQAKPAFKTCIISLFAAGLFAVLLGEGILAIIGASDPKPDARHTRQARHLRAAPADIKFYQDALAFAKDDPSDTATSAKALIVPHHLLAADILARAYFAVSGKSYKLVVLIGPDHFDRGRSMISTGIKDWTTPFGQLATDKQLVREFVSELADIRVDDGLLAGEHSINSQAAFIRHYYPEANIAVFTFRSGLEEASVSRFAEKLAGVLKNKDALVIASIDFSHGKPSEAARIEDAKSIKAIRDLDYPAMAGIDVDSKPALKIVSRFAELAGAGSFQLLENTNSAELSGESRLREVTSYVTGYFKAGPAEIPDANRQADKGLKLLFFGDLMLDRHVGERVEKNGIGWLFDRIASGTEISGAFDLKSANLEGAVTDNGSHYAPSNAYDFAFSPELVSRLKDYGFNHFNIANNHLADQGERGIRETEANLKRLGFGYTGCADGRIGPCSSAVVEAGGKKIAVAGFSMVYSRLGGGQDADGCSITPADIIKRLASSSDLVIAQVHWGVEYAHLHDRAQEQFAHELVDAGADAVIGHHPHVVQGVEVYKGAPIFYSLGNFIFDQYFSRDTQTGLALSIETAGDFLEIRIIPIKSIAGRPEIMNMPAGRELLEKLAGWSAGDAKFKKEISGGRFVLRADNRLKSGLD